MSGTSADAVDAALVDWPVEVNRSSYELVAYLEQPISAALQQRIHAVAEGKVESSIAVQEVALLDAELGERFAEAARAVAVKGGVPLAEVAAIASHGQTIGHYPKEGATLQIGAPSVIAERTGCITVANFRTRDLAAGGEGAPLAPLFHFEMFSDSSESRVILNLGGIANLTWIPRGCTRNDVRAFDVGPGNALLDCVVQIATEGKERFDKDGERALSGRVNLDLLSDLLADPFIERVPPKSTGRDRFGLTRASILLQEWLVSGGSVEDLLATLAEFTAEAVKRACTDFIGDGQSFPDRCLIGGGGAHNRAIVGALTRLLPKVKIDLFDSFGVPVDAAEAMAFSFMGRNALLGIPNHLPQCTGATGQRVVGEIVPGGLGQILITSPSSAISKPL